MKNKEVTKFDRSQIDLKGPKPLEIGVYRAKITNAEITQAKSSGNDMLVVNLEVYQDQNGEPIARKAKITDRLVLTQEALFRAAILAEALNIPLLSSNEDDEMQAFAAKVKEAGADGVWFRLSHEAYTAVNDDGEQETRQSMRVGRYLKSAGATAGTAQTVGDAPTPGTTNGAAKRPRRGAALGASAEGTEVTPN